MAQGASPLGQVADGNMGPIESVLPGPKDLAGLGMMKDPADQGQKGDVNDRLQTWVRSKWEDLRTAYTVFHQICWQNMLYYAGQLWILWDKDRRIWYPAVPEDEYTPQPIVNEFAPAIDAITSVFRIPEVEAVPKPGADDNMDAHEIAEIANALASEFMTQNGLSDGGVNEAKTGVGDRAGQFFSLTGNVFTRVRKVQKGVIQKPIIEQKPATMVRCPDCNLNETMDPSDPRIQPPPPSPSDMLMGQNVQGPQPVPCPQCGMNNVEFTPTTKTAPKQNPLNGQPMTEPQIQWDVCCDVRNPMYFLPRPGSMTFGEAGYIVEAYRLCLDDIYKEWGFEAQPDNQYLDSMESSYEISMNYYFTGYSNLTLATKESALVLIIYIEPGRVKDFQEGGVAVMVNDKIIDYKTWDECCGNIHHELTHIGYLSIPVTFFYRTAAFDLAQVQKELNRYESIIALHGMTSSSDSLIIDENTKVSNITGRGDRIVYWRSIGPGSKEPHRLQHGSLDNGIYEQRQRLRDAMQNISGAVAVWRGQQTGSVTSAAGISQLRGQAEQMFSKPTNNWNTGWAITVAKGVKLKQQVMATWEIAKLVGPGKDVQIAKFKQAKLDDVIDWKPSMHGLPRTRDEKRNDALALYDRKLLDITDPAVRTRMSELFGSTGMEEQFNLDATRARAENDAMAKGMPVQFMPDVEDLQVHLFIHGERIKRLDFDQLPDQVKQEFIQHYAETKMALTQLMLMNTESQVEYKAAAIGKEAPIQPKPGTLLGGGPDAQGGQGGPGGSNGDSGTGGPGGPPAPRGNRGGRVDGGPHNLVRRKPVAAGQKVVPTGPPARGG